MREPSVRWLGQGNCQCGARWGGLSAAHCAVCHETFSRDSNAEMHRVGAYGVDRRCLPPAVVGLVPHPTPHGPLWRHPPVKLYAADLARLRAAYEATQDRVG